MLRSLIPFTIIPVLTTLPPAHAHLQGSTRFTEFFPLLRSELTDLSTTTCASSLSTYLGDQTRLTCEAHVNCILSNMVQVRIFGVQISYVEPSFELRDMS